MNGIWLGKKSADGHRSSTLDNKRRKPTRRDDGPLRYWWMTWLSAVVTTSRMTEVSMKNIHTIVGKSHSLRKDTHKDFLFMCLHHDLCHYWTSIGNIHQISAQIYKTQFHWLQLFCGLQRRPLIFHIYLIKDVDYLRVRTNTNTILLLERWRSRVTSF